jgi:CO/xanthine dehydrogenase Mo-binding subunit
VSIDSRAQAYARYATLLVEQLEAVRDGNHAEASALAAERERLHEAYAAGTRNGAAQGAEAAESTPEFSAMLTDALDELAQQATVDQDMWERLSWLRDEAGRTLRDGTDDAQGGRAVIGGLLRRGDPAPYLSAETAEPAPTPTLDIRF